eukprot:TRINITY_DN11726_c0_g1_i1.p1 TRINITY_DN11726_c0_g1~~TRINITY_DN11726_c0_g1_i1.p1  ORF type:complete len:200 (+),score=45.19 TRINITY_DN11726_c0_g1_i1:118-717(+)
MAASALVRSSLLSVTSPIRHAAGKSVVSTLVPAASSNLFSRSFATDGKSKTWHEIHIKSVSEGLFTASKTEGGHTVVVDEPAAYGGTDKGASPLETVLSALPGCETFLARTVAKEMKFKSLGKIEYEITGGLDLAGAFGKPNVSKTFQKLHVVAKVQTDESEERVKELGEKVLSRCPVAQLFVQAGVEFTDSWVRVPSA